jgi:DNA modification methylase
MLGSLFSPLSYGHEKQRGPNGLLGAPVESVATLREGGSRNCGFLRSLFMKSPILSPVLSSRVEHWPLRRLQPYERHARKHCEFQIQQIARSIGEFGFNNPILVNPEGRIIVGAARYLAAQAAKLESVPVIVLDHLTEAQQRAYRICDNQLALNASWDEELLRLELQKLVEEALSLDLLGFSQEELTRLLASPELQRGRTPEDAVPPASAICISRPGDAWQLDQHRVVCGDATVPENIEQLMGGEQAAMSFTDPPYNVNYGARQGSTSRHRLRRPIANDDLGSAFESFLGKACRNLLNITSGAIYVCMSSSELHSLYKAFTEGGGHFSTFLIWSKNHFTLGRSDYQRQYEPILYGWREGAERFWCGARNQGDVWFFPKPKVNDLHPTMKPVALIEQALSNSSRANDLILDPFGGAGSTLIACQKKGRRARILEIEPVYVDVIIRRWQEFTGREARLEGSGQSFDELAASGSEQAA